MLLLLRHGEEKAPTPESSEQEGYSRILSPDFWYKRLVDEPKPPASHIAVIMVDKNVPRVILGNSDPQEPSACRRRLYIAQLLKALSVYAPKVVVLDMWFDPTYCSDANSQALWDELEHLSTQVSVVSGLGAYNHAGIRSALPAEFADISNRKPRFTAMELVLKPRIYPVHSGNSEITEGVVALNSDNRKIPLSWPVYDSFTTVGEVGQPRRLDSLSIAAVRAYEPKSTILKKLGALAQDGSAKISTEFHPYTSFLPEEGLPIARAIDVICSAHPDDSWKIECATVGNHSFGSHTMIDGKIILIGLGGDSEDFHESLIGNVPGVILQANYIESLLCYRFYRPLSTSPQIVIAIVWLGFVFFVPWYPCLTSTTCSSLIVSRRYCSCLSDALDYLALPLLSRHPGRDHCPSLRSNHK
jgi:hypothetical protein